MRAWARVACGVALLAGSQAVAQEFVRAAGPLTDDDFYRAVACAAPPGGACAKPFLYWSESRRRDLTVGFASLADGLPAYKRAGFDAALDGAIAEINGVGADLRLVRTTEAPDIPIHVVETPPGHVMRDTGVPELDGAALPLGRVALKARDGTISEALIAVSMHARRREIASVLLEEITQALGLITDIKGDAVRRSLFSEDGNSVTRLRGQDRMALRRHYPPRPRT